jgi:hypothetical protein
MVGLFEQLQSNVQFRASLQLLGLALLSKASELSKLAISVLHLFKSG